MVVGNLLIHPTLSDTLIVDVVLLLKLLLVDGSELTQLVTEAICNLREIFQIQVR